MTPFGFEDNGSGDQVPLFETTSTITASGDHIFNKMTAGSNYRSNDAADEHQSAPTPHECVVCALESIKGEFPASSPTPSCSHPPELCLECLQQVILVAITDGSCVSGIECPSNTCSQKLGYFDVKKWANKKDFDRFASLDCGD
jgi:hypothetical protein